MLQICPKIPNQKFEEPPFEEAILTFLKDRGHSGEIKVHQAQILSVNESEEDNNQVNDRYKASEGYHAVPPLYTGNFMPPRHNLSFVELDDSVFKSAMSDTVTSMHETKTSASKTSKEREPSSWVRPDGLQVVKSPNMKFCIASRPKNTNRIKSQGEEPIQVRCSRCGVPYTNNYVRSQEYEAAYTNNYARSQEYEVAFNNMDGGLQGYEVAYTNFNNIFEQSNINFYGQSHHPLPTTPFTFSQFNLSQSLQQTYSIWDSSSWDPVNLADP
nr:hypothetical protein [Tanacetum cinerariifolium]